MRLTSACTCVGKEDGKTCKRVAIRTTIRKDDCRSNAPVRRDTHRHTMREAEHLNVVTTNTTVVCFLMAPTVVPPPPRSQSIRVMGNARQPPYSTLTSTVMPGSVSAAAKTDYRPALLRCTAPATPLWWTTTSKSLWTVPASGTENRTPVQEMNE